VIEELIKLAKEMDAATKRGRLGLNRRRGRVLRRPRRQRERREAMGDDKLKVIAAELITKVRKSVTIDWTLRESARAKIKVMVKRILNKYGYPPDLQEEAVKTLGQKGRELVGARQVGVGGAGVRVERQARALDPSVLYQAVERAVRSM
jgi:hypothetical protein